MQKRQPFPASVPPSILEENKPIIAVPVIDTGNECGALSVSGTLAIGVPLVCWMPYSTCAPTKGSTQYSPGLLTGSSNATCTLANLALLLGACLYSCPRFGEQFVYMQPPPCCHH